MSRDIAHTSTCGPPVLPVLPVLPVRSVPVAARSPPPPDPTDQDGPSAVDRVLGSGAVVRFTETIREAMDSGVIAEGDTLPVVLELWAAAHGIASLLIAKPALPWGDVDTIIDRVLGAACLGHAVLDIIGCDPVPEPDEGARWLAELRRAQGESGD